MVRSDSVLDGWGLDGWVLDGWALDGWGLEGGERRGGDTEFVECERQWPYRALGGHDGETRTIVWRAQQAKS